jgi:hypothetical protein
VPEDTLSVLYTIYVIDTSGNAVSSPPGSLQLRESTDDGDEDTSFLYYIVPAIIVMLVFILFLVLRVRRLGEGHEE